MYRYVNNYGTRYCTTYNVCTLQIPPAVGNRKENLEVLRQLYYARRKTEGEDIELSKQTEVEKE